MDIQSTPSANRRTESWTGRKMKRKVFWVNNLSVDAGQACKVKSFTSQIQKRKHGLPNKGNPLPDGMEMISALSEQQWSAKWKQKLIYRNVYKQVTFVLSVCRWIGRLTDVLGGRQLCTCHRETLDRQKCDDEWRGAGRKVPDVASVNTAALFWWIRYHPSLSESRSSINVATSDPHSGTAVRHSAVPWNEALDDARLNFFPNHRRAKSSIHERSSNIKI